MPKKRRRPRKPRMPDHGGPRRLHAVRTATADLAGMRGPFLAWLGAHGLPAHIDPAALWDEVVVTVDLAVTRAGLTDLRSWTARQIDTLAEHADADESEALTTLPLLLAFLGDTGRWSATTAQLDAAISAAEEATSPVPEVLAELADVHVDPETENAALRALPAVERAEALLRFVLPRRPVTTTGALRRADIAAAADLVGVDLDGRTPRSMWDVPQLADIWAAMQQVGLLVVTPSEATVSPVAHGWLTGNAEQARQARLLVAGGYLAQLLDARPEAPWEADPLDTVLPALATAAVGHPVPTAQVLGDLDALLDGLPPGGTAVPQPGVGLDARLMRTLVALPARALVQQLTAEGFLEVSDTITAAPGLQRVLARVTAAMLGAQQQFDSIHRGSPDLPAPDPDLAGQAYRLRIELADASPPVWREVLVDPGIPLDELHEVIQVLFEWEDAHLHEFTVVGPGRQTVRFGPQDDDGWMPRDESVVDESRVRLSQVIGPRRGKLRYLYDFGDGWEHLITVVGREPASGSSPPRCTAGAGAAPHEDSGGVWGWTDKVQAARDPRHPEYADIRDWLGLQDGETLDAGAFDLTEVDQRLAALRR
ncbi:plasmid pRiA4b ORF-3 family protein [Blastococcus mobilis]|uniref:PRiA4b ORF-3-like protein n=1 Tax=Blastococcus mobilis TaxID=1938746 RepID=A0A238WGH9_9ACTN|nr:plasmid pRiA4b ORF-3 family protein [Blastococcus mobilis]SNR45692.1 pRiA4b ORF-3-like protein [Blastococcus mobilis]